MLATTVLNRADITILLVSLALTVFIGLWASRRQADNTRGYFLASNKLPWWLIGPSIVSTSVSSEQIVGTVGACYANGMAVANWEWFTLPLYTLVMVFFIPVYLRNRVVTVSDYFARRFGPRCADMLVVYVVVFLVPVLFSGSFTFSELTGMEFRTVLWLSVIVVAVYTVHGGMESVMWTNLIQTILLMGGGLALFFVVLAKVPGGWSAMAAANPERFHLYRPDDPIAPFPAIICLTVGLGLFYQGTNQVMIQRVLGARSVWDGILGTIFAGYINFARPLVTCFLGLVVYHWIHAMHMAAPLDNQDKAFPFALSSMAPEWGIRGIVLAGFVAAVLSTVSSLVNSTAALFSLDVYKKLINPFASEGRTVRVGQMVSMAALLIAACIAPVVERIGIFRYFQMLVTYTATPFIAVMLVGLFWKRANYAGGLVGLLGGGAIMAALATGDHLLGRHTHWLYLGFFAQVSTMLLVVVVSLATAPPEPKSPESLVWRPAFLAAYTDVKVPWYKQLKLWYGLYAVIWFYLYWQFW